ncbi:sugar phosphate isomerase/epimerase [Glycomyces sp. A-F 0318]|uniref:sugar phosphate isomerase/epimerase family protein n=1 Tax=Glycomyces amatae TaxID=2881355 RepID=UPI001E4585A1|nr:sugar phosphate isomerase/epimerase family protein [Glycomyces amatae]MCD0445527.1 sugar phosphate isomerase/epimerase [Glycomyces amatae]
MQVQWTLSGFGDEIDPDPSVQAAVLAAHGARHVEVRSAWGVNVVDMDDEVLARVTAALRERSTAVSAVASPIGKSQVSQPVGYEVERLRRLVRVADAFGTRYVRIFSYYREADQTPESVREAVLERMGALADTAKAEGLVLLHENEKGIYGDTPERVLDLMAAVDSPALRVAWDSANFVQVGVRPFDEGYAILRPYLEYLQVKDAILATGAVVPAGEGDGQLRETLAAMRADGFTGFASLEPHLAASPSGPNREGPEAFGRAARAFAALAAEAGAVLV